MILLPVPRNNSIYFHHTQCHRVQHHSFRMLDCFLPSRAETWSSCCSKPYRQSQYYCWFLDFLLLAQLENCKFPQTS